MQINNNIQSNVLMAQNKPIQKVEDTSTEQVNEKKIGEEKLGEKKYQEIINYQDSLISSVMDKNSNKDEIKNDLAKIEEKLNTNNFKNEDFSKLNKENLKSQEFIQAQQVNLNQQQIASLLA